MVYPIFNSGNDPPGPACRGVICVLLKRHVLIHDRGAKWLDTHVSEGECHLIMINEDLPTEVWPTVNDL